MTARITARMSNGFLRSGFVVEEKISPTVVNSLPSARWGALRTSRATGSELTARRGQRSLGAR